VMGVEITAENMETLLVGAGLGHGFTNTAEMKVMNYQDAMKCKDDEAWKEEVVKEKERYDKFKVFTSVLNSDVPEGAKKLATTWAIEKKTNGKFHATMNTQGYGQIEGKHVIADSIAVPVTNSNTVHILPTLLAMNPMISELINAEGAFLQGKFVDGEEM